jgi:type II secretory pathway predicted ATPase ExeA
MMYERFYGLREKPFSLLPDPAYLYLSEKHQMAATLLEYAVTNQAGFSVITGEIGAGKTTLIRYLLDRLDRDTTVGLISNTHPSLGGLLRWVVLAFDLPGENHSLPDMYQRFVDYLIAQYAKGRRTVLIVDEAQNLAVETLEELRMLSNVNADKDQVLQTILVGQPGLRTTLRRPELAQFAQRIVVDFHLESLDPQETRAYIRHRLKVAGGNPEIFSDDACNAVHRYSRGSPRLINLICDMSLVYGFAEQSATVAESLVSDVVRDRQRLGCLPILADVPDPPLASARHAVAPISLASAAAMRTSLASAPATAATNETPAATDKNNGMPASERAAGSTPTETASATVTATARPAAPEPSVTVEVAEPEIVRLSPSPATSYPPPSSAQPITVVPKSAPGQPWSRRFHSLSVGVGFAAGAVLSIGVVAAFLLRGNPGGDPTSERLAAAGVAPAVAASAPVLASTGGNNGDTHPVATPATPADAAATQTVGGKDAAEAKTRERELQASLAASKAETERLRAEAALAATRAEAERLRGEASRATSKLEAERMRAEAALAAAQAETERLRSQAAAAAAATPATIQNEPAAAASGKKASTAAKTTSTANDTRPIFQSNPCKGVSARFLSTCDD